MNKNEIEIDLKNELLITTNTSFRKLLELGGDVMALYMFYLYTGNWQDNQSPKATTDFTAKGLGWGVDKVRKNKKILEENGWIEEKIIKNKDTQKIEGHYITVKFRISTLAEIQRVDIPDSGKSDPNTPIINKIHPKDNKIHKKITKKENCEQVAELKDKENEKINHLEYYDKMMESDKEHIRLLGYYFFQKKIVLDTKEKIQQAIRISAKCAIEITKAKYDAKSIENAFYFFKTSNLNWSLNAIAKYLANN